MTSLILLSCQMFLLGFRFLSDVDADFYRHPRQKFFIMMRAFVDSNFHRYALYDFGEIAAGVFWRQKTEFCTAGWREGLNPTGKMVIGKSINLNLDLLTFLHVGQLNLFEVCFDPNII